MSFVSCSKLTADQAAQDAALKAYADDAAAAAANGVATPDASESTKGKVELASATEAGNGAAGLALTPENLNVALNSGATAGGNPAQKAVVNAVEQAIASDTGAQAAIAGAIVDDIVGSTAFTDAVDDAVADALAGGVAPSGAAGGDLEGTYPNPTVKTSAVSAAVVNGTAAEQKAIADAIVDDLPDTAKTVRGLVNLTDLQQMGDGRKVFDAGVHVGNGNPAFAGRATVTAIGPNAGQNNTGVNQTATGVFAGQNNAGDYQTATGVSAGQNNTGAFQAANGYAAGTNNTGSSQTATGAFAGQNNTGAFQTATGVSAGQNNTGANNSFYGAESGAQTGTLLGTVTMTPSSSTAGTVSPALPASVVGKSLPVNISGFDWRVLTFTSTTAYTTVGGPASGTWTANVHEGLAFNNVTALGYDSEPTASNQVMLGNGAVTEVRTAGTYFGAGFTTVSDATLKENVEDIDPAKALAFRNGLKWKRFEVFSETQSEVHETKRFEREDADGKKVQVEMKVPTGAYKTLRTSQGVQYGLIAQEVKALAKKVGAFDDVVIVIGEYFDLDADGFPKKDAKGNAIKHKRLGLNYDAINVIVMAGEQAAMGK